ncbi:MAG TPA: hypothetical protein DEP87_03490, partial [Candidatus Pacebacteria bacterium]|nr:hypothetical protein [Candidatus Paceibacterota bacterium]
IGVYEFSLVKLNKKIGLMALAFLAVSPLAIAHSRMVYHTGPIPLLTVLSLWTLTRVLERRDWSAAWAMLSITLLFQHELSLFPIFLALPLAWWWGGWQLGLKGNQLWKLSRRETAASCVALMIGLLPQLVSEFQNHSGQLSGFGLWLIYRCLSFLNPSSNHFGLTSLSLAITSLSQYASRVFITPQSGWIGIGVMGVLTGLTLWGWIKLLTKPKLLSPAAAITGLATGLIGLGYLVHGAPSEAYFPAAVVLLPLMIAIGWATLDFKWRLVGSLNLILSLGLAVWGVWQSQWFVDQTTTWNYGPSLKTQQTALRWLNLTLKQPTFQVSSRDPGSEFDNYLAGYVWLGKGLNLEVNAKRNFITQDRVQISQVATQTHQMSFSDSARLTRFRPEYLDLPSLKLMIRP